MKNKKSPKENRLTIRLSDDEKALLEKIQKALYDPIRGELNLTESVVASLRIAAEKLGIKV